MYIISLSHVQNHTVYIVKPVEDLFLHLKSQDLNIWKSIRFTDQESSKSSKKRQIL